MSIPTRLGRYAVRSRLGAGAFATVWLAHDERLDSAVAVKVLAENWAGDAHVRQRFVEEGRFLRRVESPHVVSVYDAGELPDGRPYLVMAYADQGTLADRLQVGQVPAELALSIIAQVAAGLDTLHRRDVLHRDVKPANVLFRTVAGEVRAMVGDLGLGKALDMSSRLSLVGGTPSFMAPEQARGERLDQRTDEYALAALAYLLLSGRPAYTHASLTAAASPAPAPRLDELVSGEPAGPRVGEVLAKGLAVRPEDRYPDVLTFAAELSRGLGAADAGSGLLSGWVPTDPDRTQVVGRPADSPAAEPVEEPAGEPPPSAPRSRRWWPLAAALVALVCGAVVGVAAYRHNHRTVDLTDADGVLSVTVPDGWDAVRATHGWTPPGSDHPQPALSVGSALRWQQPGPGSGVFIGLMPAEDLPDELPGHPECAETSDPIRNDFRGDLALTAVSTGCPGVVIERTVQVADTLVLWIQVKGTDRATANVVLDSVRTHGI